MIRSTLLAAVLLASAVGGAAAEPAERVTSALAFWQGSLFVTAADATCVAYGTKIGQYGVAIYRPRLSPAEPASALMIQYTRGNVLLTRTGGPGSDKMNSAGTFAGSYVGPTAVPPTPFTGSYTFALTPSNPLSTSNFVNMTGTITNFDGITNCTVSIRAAFSRAP